jgi:MFS family permease
VLSRLHNDKNDPEEVAAREEFYQMRKQLEFEATNPHGYMAIFRTKAYRRRAFLSCFIQYAANATGALVINYYSVIIYENLGLKTYMPLLMYCIYTLIGALGNLFSLLTIDKTGRRFVSAVQQTPHFEEHWLTITVSPCLLDSLVSALPLSSNLQWWADS